MIVEKHHALASLRPNSNWCMSPEGVIEWLDNIQIQPTEQEIQNEIIRLQDEHLRTEYQRRRAQEYPSIGDQLDALFHAGLFPPEMAATIQSIKDKYPKSN
jgi:hypothetical protein